MTKTETMDVKDSKLWGGRFHTALDPLMEQFNASLQFDKRLHSVDIVGSIAYAKALLKCSLLTGMSFEWPMVGTFGDN